MGLSWESEVPDGEASADVDNLSSPARLSPGPTVDYPCPWEYVIVGPCEEKMSEAVGRIAGRREYSLTKSNTSRTGKYSSLRLRMTVLNEDHRKQVFNALSNDPDIMMVL